MSTYENGPALIDAAAVAGVSIPPGTGSFMRPPLWGIPDAAAPGTVQVAGGESGPAAQNSSQAADSALTVASATPEATTAPGASQGLVPSVPTIRAPRTDVRPLAWPLDFEGKFYERIVVKRPSTREVGDYYDRLRQLPAGDTKGLRFPIFYHEDGTPVPDAVLDALDDDDADTLEADIADFLPRRLRVLTLPPAGSIQNSGADIGPTSAA